jgi:predicted DNA-binding transcriptional regulator AlpA
MNAEDRATPQHEPLAITIAQAAKMVGMSRSMFYRVYLDAGRIQTVPKGRWRMIDVVELRRAYARYIADTRDGA